jgi:hypothetical protein
MRFSGLGCSDAKTGVHSNGFAGRILPTNAQKSAEECRRHDVPHVLWLASIVFKKSTGRITWEERTNRVEMFYVKGKAIQGAQMHRCKFECDSEIVTDARTARTCYEEVEEWPVGWPSD